MTKGKARGIKIMLGGVLKMRSIKIKIVLFYMKIKLLPLMKEQTDGLLSTIFTLTTMEELENNL